MLRFFSLRESAQYLLILGGVLFINILSIQWHLRWDVTQDQVYSVSDASARLLEKVDHNFHVKFFFSRSRKQLPVIVKTYGMRIEEVLQAFKAKSHGTMAVDVIDPIPDTEQEEWARRFGLTAAQLPDGEQVFFGMVLIRGNREVVLPYLDATREKFLEYDLSEAIFRVQQDKRPQVGVMTNLPAMGSDLPFSLPNVPTMPAWQSIQELKKLADVQRIPTQAGVIPEHIQILVLLHPKKLSEKTLYAIDQFAMRGGKLYVALDPLSRLDLPPRMDPRNMKTIPDPSSELDRLFATWGIDYTNAVIGDLKNPTRIGMGGTSISYPMYISVKRDLLNSKSVITGQLNEVVIGEGGALALKAGSSLSMEPLLKTSTDSGIFPDPFLAGYIGAQAELERQLKVDGQSRVLAAVFRGKLKSAFPQGLPKDEREVASGPHLAESTGEATLLVVSDTDFLRDENSVQINRGTGQTTTKLINDNQRFFLAGMEYLSGNEDLIALRSRGQLTRPFTRLQNLEKQAQLRWRAEDERLASRLQQVEEKLNKLQVAKTAENRMQLSPEQVRELQAFQQEQASVRRMRKDVRRGLREDIDGLGKRLTLANMGLVPLAVGAFGVQFFFRRYRRMRRGKRAQK